MSPSALAELGSATFLSAVAGTWPRARVSAIFAWRHRRLPKLSAPAHYNDWVQWRKLNDRDSRLAMLTDKLHGKALAARLVGSDLVIPTLWQGTQLPDTPPWPMPFVVKANHGCKQFVVVRTPDDWQLARRMAPRWLTAPYGRWLDEWHYRAARRRLMVEPFVGPPTGLPVDYKVYVFGGRAEFVQVHLDRDGEHRWAQFDRAFNRVSRATGEAIAPPLRLEEMLAAAERIAAGHDHLRVDFYEVDGQLWFGELCLFPGSGLDPFDPVELDAEFGRLWSESRTEAAKAAPIPAPVEA